MAAVRLTIPLPVPPPGDALDEPTGDDRRPMVELLDDSGEAVAEPVPAIVPEPRWVEGRGPDGGLAWGPVAPRISLSLDPPPNAVGVRITSAGQTAEFALADVVDPAFRPPDARRRFPEADRHWTLAVVSERFDDEDDFFEHADSFHQFVSTQAPFSDPAVSFGIQALFWRSDRVEGMFGASDRNLSGRVLDGDNDRVVRFVHQAQVNPRKILVLVNSAKRAGAGGQGQTTPSWCTISSPSFEPWEGIALHELGHAFGLADEYDSAFDLAEPNPLEPNVSRERDPSQTSWHEFATVAAPPAPTAMRGFEDGHSLTTVGTFQGARYREADRFRPSPNCRMRMTTIAFCPVCQAHIRKELLA